MADIIERLRLIAERTSLNGDMLDIRIAADRISELETLLRECLGDYGHPRFTDRHGMADRIRKILNINI